MGKTKPSSRKDSSKTHSGKKTKSSKTLKKAKESSRQRSKTAHSSKKSKDASKKHAKHQIASKKEESSKTKKKSSMKKADKKTSEKVSAKTARKNKSTKKHSDHEVKKKSRSRSPSVKSSKHSNNAYTTPTKQSSKKKTSPSTASTVSTASTTSSKRSATSSMRKSLIALDFDSMPTSVQKKQKIAKDEPIEKVDFLSSECLNKIICRHNPALDPNQVKITAYNEKATNVAKNYPPKTLMVPYIQLSTVHNVALKGVNPAVDFISTEKSCQYLVQLLMKIRRKKKDADNNDNESKKKSSHTIQASSDEDNNGSDEDTDGNEEISGEGKYDDGLKDSSDENNEVDSDSEDEEQKKKHKKKKKNKRIIDSDNEDEGNNEDPDGDDDDDDDSSNEQSKGKNESASDSEEDSSEDGSKDDEESTDDDSHECDGSDKNSDSDNKNDSSDDDGSDNASENAKSDESEENADDESIDSNDSLPISPKKGTLFADGNNENAMNLLGKKIQNVKGSGRGEMSEKFPDKKGNVCIAVDCGELSTAWWASAMFIIQCVQACVQSTPGANKDTKWPLTIDVVNIRAGQHGDNHYKRDDRGRFVRHIIFIMKTKKEHEHYIYNRAQKRAKYIFECMEKLAEEGSAKNALDLMEGDSTQRDDGSWGGLYGYFMKGRDKATVINRLKNDIKNQFKKEIDFRKERIALDKYLTDYDIKEIAKDIFNAKSWDDVPLDAKKVFYKENYGSQFLPAWNDIIEETRTR